MGGTVIRQRDRFFIQLYWDGKKERFWTYLLKEDWIPFYDEKTAWKVLGAMQTEIDVGDFNPKAWRPGNPFSVSKYSEVWLRHADITKNARKTYRSCIKHAGEFFKNKPIHAIRKVNILDFKTYLQKKEYSPSMVYNSVTALKTMLRFAYDNEDIRKIPPFPKLSKDIKDEIEYLTIEQQEAILSNIPWYHRPIFEFMMEYGLRVQEGEAFMKDCIGGSSPQFPTGSIEIRRRYSEYELLEYDKTGNAIKYGITSRCKRILADAARAAREHFENEVSPFAFIKNRTGSHYDNKALNRIWKDACSKTGVSIKLQNALRHSFACQLLDEDVPYEDVSSLLRHTSVQITKDRYGRRSKAKLQNILENRGQMVSIGDHLVTKNQ